MSKKGSPCYVGLGGRALKPPKANGSGGGWGYYAMRARAGECDPKCAETQHYPREHTAA